MEREGRPRLQHLEHQLGRQLLEVLQRVTVTAHVTESLHLVGELVPVGADKLAAVLRKFLCLDVVGSRVETAAVSLPVQDSIS